MLCQHNAGANGWTLITSAVEHPSVLRPAESFARQGGQVLVLDVSPQGVIDPEDVVRAARKSSGRIKLSIQWANSETGVIQPIGEIAQAVRSVQPEAMVHSDIAQAIGRDPIDLAAAGVDAATFSGHKFHGPQGSGALVLSDPDDHRLEPFLLGGGQERGLRSGTQNVPGIVGLGVAADVRASCLDKAIRKMRSVRDCFEKAVMVHVPQASINGTLTDRLPNTSNIRFPGIDGMSLLAKLDEKSVACSLGSACSSGKPSPSHVLQAMGMSEQDAYSSVRFSFSVFNSKKEALLAAQILAECVRELR